MAKFVGKLSPEEMAEKMRIQNPHLFFAIYDNGSAIAYRKRDCDKWTPLLAKLVGGGWANIYTELAADGQPVWRNDRWRHVAPKESEG